MKWLLPPMMLAVFLLYIGAVILPPGSLGGGFDFGAFGSVPVLLNEHIRPIESVGRIALLEIVGSVAVPSERPHGWRFWKRTPGIGASEWLAEVLMKPQAADARSLFPISQRQLRDKLALPAPAGARTIYVSFSDLQSHLPALGAEATRIAKIKPAERAAWERECITLRNSVIIYDRLKNSLQPNSVLQQQAAGGRFAYDFDAAVTRYKVDLMAVQAAISRGPGQQKVDPAAGPSIRAFAQPFVSVERTGMLALIPPYEPGAGHNRWQNIGKVIVDSARTAKLPLSVGYFAAMSSAMSHGDPLAFNAQVSNYLAWLTTTGRTSDVDRAWYEQFTLRLSPLVRAVAIYLFAVGALAIARLRRSPALYRAAIALVGLAFVLQTYAVLSSTIIEGGPRLNTSDALFIVSGWAFVLVGGWIERLRRTGLAAGLAALIAVAGIALAHDPTPAGAWQLLRAALDGGFLIAAAAAALLAWQAGRAPAPATRQSSAAPAAAVSGAIGRR